MEDISQNEDCSNKRIKFSSDKDRVSNEDHSIACPLASSPLFINDCAIRLGDSIKSTVDENRSWIFTEYGKKYLKNPKYGLDFSVMTYNVLSQQNLELNSYLYSHCDDYVLDWAYRAPNLLSEIQKLNVDIICLQELEKGHYEDTFKPHFESLGYSNVFKKKTGIQNDGCAIFFKKDMFTLDSCTTVEFRSNEARILDRDNVGLIAVLKSKSDERIQKLCVATTHLLFNPRRGDVKLSQLRYFLAEIDKLAFKGYSESNYPLYHPIILCGDMNSEPFSPLYNFLTSGYICFKDMKAGSVSGQAEGFNKGRLLTTDDLTLSPMGISDESVYKQLDENRFKKWISEKSVVNNVSVGSQRKTLLKSRDPSVGIVNNTTSSSAIWHACTSAGDTAPERHKKNKIDSFSHHLKLLSSYKHFKLNGTKEATIHNSGSSCTVDYIFYNVKYKHSFLSKGMPKHKNIHEGSLKLLGYYGLLGEKDFEGIGGLPNSYLSSDHICLVSRFLLKL